MAALVMLTILARSTACSTPRRMRSISGRSTSLVRLLRHKWRFSGGLMYAHSCSVLDTVAGLTAICEGDFRERSALVQLTYELNYGE